MTEKPKINPLIPHEIRDRGLGILPRAEMVTGVVGRTSLISYKIDRMLEGSGHKEQYLTREQNFFDQKLLKFVFTDALKIIEQFPETQVALAELKQSFWQTGESHLQNLEDWQMTAIFYFSVLMKQYYSANNIFKDDYMNRKWGVIADKLITLSQKSIEDTLKRNLPYELKNNRSRLHAFFQRLLLQLPFTLFLYFAKNSNEIKTMYTPFFEPQKTFKAIDPNSSTQIPTYIAWLNDYLAYYNNQAVFEDPETKELLGYETDPTDPEGGKRSVTKNWIRRGQRGGDKSQN